MTTLLHAPNEYPLGLVLRATLALNFMAFTEFTFGVVRPNTLFKPNWHLQAPATPTAPTSFPSTASGTPPAR